jgi:hypothetical protein
MNLEKLATVLKTRTAKRGIAPIVIEAVANYQESGRLDSIRTLLHLIEYINWERYPADHEYSGEFTLLSQQDKNVIKEILQKEIGNDFRELLQMTSVNYDGD